jgi:hypothetical protein
VKLKLEAGADLGRLLRRDEHTAAGEVRHQTALQLAEVAKGYRETRGNAHRVALVCALVAQAR